MYPQYMFKSKNMKKVKKNQLKIVIFTAVKNCCILHGRVFVMSFFQLRPPVWLIMEKPEDYSLA